jgi:DNA-directed RNA polymerase specialized sigma24 family protein
MEPPRLLGCRDGVRLEDADWLALEEAYPRVYRALLASGATPDAAADAVQDAFEQALRRDHHVDRPEGWLFIVAIRRWRRSMFRARLFRPLSAVRPAYAGPDPLGVVLAEELARLTRREREIIVARYVLGLSQSETAKAFGITAGTVGTTTFRASRKLRERLADK